MKKETILITGGCGYVGLSLVEQLLKKEHELNIEKITLFDNLTFKESCCLPFLRHPKVEVIVQDVKRKPELIKAVQSHSVIYTLAGIVGAPASAKNPEEAWAVNHEHLKTVADNINPDTKLISVCTNSVYGDVGGTVDETGSIRCISIYSQSKYKGEQEIISKQGISLRFATLCGLGFRQRRDLLVNTMIWEALTKKYILIYQPQAMRCYLSLNDAARSLVHSLENYNKMKGNVYNCGNDILNASKISLANKIKEYLPDFVIKTEEYKVDEDARDYAVKSSKLYETGFICEDGWNEIIPSVIKGYKTLMEAENWFLT